MDKYVLPETTYESLPNSVLAWKKNQKLGRFDPNAASPEVAMHQQAEKDAVEVQKRGMLSILPQTLFLPSFIHAYMHACMQVFVPILLVYEL